MWANHLSHLNIELRKTEEAKVKENTMTTNKEKSSMITRSERKITRFNQEESISTECDKKPRKQKRNRLEFRVEKIKLLQENMAPLRMPR